ncbi:MAG: Fe-S cluster assembly protein SufD [Ktedonobacterales bacterium]
MTAPTARRGFTEDAMAELIQRRAEPEWMTERRLESFRIYQELPMPTQQDEEWRRTSLRDIHLEDVELKTEWKGPVGTLLPEAERKETFGGFLGIHDGRRVEYRVTDELAARGVIFTDMATAVREHADLVREYFMTMCVPPADSKFAALHGAFWDTGTFLYVPKGVAVELPLRTIVSASMDGTASLAHTLIVLDERSQATFAEDFTSPLTGRAGFSSRVTEIIQRAESNLHYVGLQRWGKSALDFHTERVMLDRDSTVILQTVELGSRLSKGRVEAILHGNGATAKLLGLYVEDGRQHLDRYTLQDHRAANGTSDLLFKGVLTDKSRSVFSGMIRVRPEGKKTAAYQQNRNLLLSPGARADSIPNLEIGANDIIGCSHGATIGKVDEEQLFYLMCRGLSRIDATHLIVEGFVDPLIEQVPIAGLREALRQDVAARVSVLQAQ